MEMRLEDELDREPGLGGVAEVLGGKANVRGGSLESLLFGGVSFGLPVHKVPGEAISDVELG